jgi:hypothetical protein
MHKYTRISGKVHWTTFPQWKYFLLNVTFHVEVLFLGAGYVFRLKLSQREY